MTLFATLTWFILSLLAWVHAMRMDAKRCLAAGRSRPAYLSRRGLVVLVTNASVCSFPFLVLSFPLAVGVAVPTTLVVIWALVLFGRWRDRRNWMRQRQQMMEAHPGTSTFRYGPP